MKILTVRSGKKYILNEDEKLDIDMLVQYAGRYESLFRTPLNIMLTVIMMSIVLMIAVTVLILSARFILLLIGGL